MHFPPKPKGFGIQRKNFMIKKSSDIKNGLFNNTNQETLFLDKEKNNDLWIKSDRESYYRAINTKISRYGLIAEYLMKVENGDLIDSSYNDNHGTTENIVVGNNNFCDFIELNGNSSSVNCGDVRFFQPTESLSLSVWIYAHSEMSSYGAIYAKNLVIRFAVKSGSLAIHGSDDYADGFAWGSDNLGKISLNQWHHVVLIVNLYQDAPGGIAYTYIDSIPTGLSVAVSTLPENYNDNCYIGSLSGGSNFFDGKLSKMRVYNKVLSQNEVTSLYEEISLYDKINNMCKVLYTMDSIIGTTVYDEMNIKNATAVDISSVQGKYGNAASFNGSSSRINLDGMSFIKDKISLSMWIKASEAASTYKYLFDSNPTRFVFAWNGDSSGKFGIYSAPSWHNLDTIAPNDDSWHHICLVINNTSAKLYLDGFNIEDETIDAIDLSSSTDTIIGCEYTEISYFFNGAIDDFRIYAKALSDEEVYYLYDKKY